MTIECPSCDRAFDSERGVSQHHFQAHGESIAGVACECDECGESIRRERWKIENYNHTFCSQDCHKQYHRDRETVECAQCGTEKVVHSHRLDRSENFYCDNECAGRWRSDNLNGADSPTWRGGKSMYDAVKRSLGERSWNYLRKQARQRGDECQMCGGDNGDEGLHVHHIVPILCGGSNHRDNLMLLCRSCHTVVEAHTRRMLEPVLVEHAP